MQVIVSLTTIPDRVRLLEPVIKSLLSQQYTVAQVLVNVPLAYKSWPNAIINNIPPFLKQPRVVLNRQCIDDGPITKVLGFSDRVDRYANIKTLLVYVDDDHVYPKDFIAAHVRAHEVCPRTVFAGRGSLLKENNRVILSTPWFQRLHTADGVQGVSVFVHDINWRLLASRAREWISADEQAFLSDDIVLSALFWEQGLKIRLLATQTTAVPLKHAGDEFALCNGRNGLFSETSERYSMVIKNYAPRDAWLTNVTVGDCVSIMDEIYDATGEVAITIFAYQRPELLERVLQSILKNAWFQERQCPVYLFIDGYLHPETALPESDKQRWISNQTIFKRLVPNGIIMAAAVNYGIGMMQHWALSVLSDRYENIIMLEDDLVLGPTYLESLWSMRSLCRGKISTVQCGYRREHGSPHLIKITNAALHHVHYWGWLITAENYKKIEPMYTAAVKELFQGQYYRRRNFDRIREWFKRNNLKDYGRYSQDWVRDGCFHLAGMPYKAYTPCRRGVPIGRDGLHSNSALFDKMGLDDCEFDVKAIPALQMPKAKLTWDAEFQIHVIKPAQSSVLGQTNVGVVLKPNNGNALKYVDNTRQAIDVLISNLFS